MEDFLTFEIAQKLKEKGFREECLAYYDVNDNVGLLYNTQYSDDIIPCQYTDLLASHNIGEGMLVDDSDYCVDAPFISQVLKWLRNEKKIFINVDVRTNLEWYYEVWNINKKLSVLGNVDFNKSESYEKSAIAGIEYVLNNLI